MGRATCIAIVVCEEIRQDPANGTTVLYGIIKTLGVPYLPAVSQLGVMVTVTGATRFPTFELRLTFPNGKFASSSYTPPLPHYAANEPHDILFGFPQVPFEDEGVCRLEFRDPSGILAARTFKVEVMTPGASPQKLALG